MTQVHLLLYLQDISECYAKGMAMTGDIEASADRPSFERLKRMNHFGAEYWSARDLQALLGYKQWRRFDEAIQRAVISCTQSGNDPSHHFAGVGKMMPIGKGAFREVQDFHLSRFACYLIAQNGDPRKIEIAEAQKYFALQTRRQEVSDALAADMERLELREQARQEFRALSGVAQDAGVNSKMFGVFHDAGYKGLYGGLGVAAIKKRKEIPERENLLDRMGTTELAANQFRMTQARDKLKTEQVRSEKRAIDIHHQVGREVRAAIQRIGGELPENIAPAEHIKEVKKRMKKSIPRIELKDEDAKGLIGDDTP